MPPPRPPTSPITVNFPSSPPQINLCWWGKSLCVSLHVCRHLKSIPHVLDSDEAKRLRYILLIYFFSLASIFSLASPEVWVQCLICQSLSYFTSSHTQSHLEGEKTCVCVCVWQAALWLTLQSSVTLCDNTLPFSSLSFFCVCLHVFQCHRVFDQSCDSVRREIPFVIQKIQFH